MTPRRPRRRSRLRCAWLAVAASLAAAAVVAGCGGSSTGSSAAPSALLFVSTRDGDYAVFGADADGSGAKRLTEEKGDPSSPRGLFFQMTPAWSPDGRRIAFSSSRDGVAHLFVMDADGSGTASLTGTAKNDNAPSWSPDGTSIVFAREGALFRLPVAGGTAERVGGKQFGSAANPVYSPDGTMIAYDYRSPGSGVREVYVMRADGTGIRRVTSMGDVSSAPAWSPDGTRLAFQSNARSGNEEIYTVGLDGKGLRRETVSTTDAIQPAWTPDGTGVTFSRDGALWTVRDGEETQLTDGDGNDSSPVYRPVTAGDEGGG